MKTEFARRLINAGPTQKFDREKLRACKDAKKTIDDLVKNHERMSAEDVASVMSAIYSVNTIAPRVN